MPQERTVSESQPNETLQWLAQNIAWSRRLDEYRAALRDARVLVALVTLSDETDEELELRERVA